MVKKYNTKHDGNSKVKPSNLKALLNHSPYSLQPMQSEQNWVGEGVAQLVCDRPRGTQRKLNVNMYWGFNKIPDDFEISPGRIWFLPFHC